jgi:hypothetical protein
LEEGEHLRRGNSIGQVLSELHRQECIGWISAAMNAIQLACPDPANAYRKKAEQTASDLHGLMIPTKDWTRISRRVNCPLRVGFSLFILPGGGEQCRNRGQQMNKRQLPLIGVLLGFALILVATRFYPGGTLDDPTAVGFDWSRNYLTNLFRPSALNGQKNAAMPYAVAGMWLICGGMAELFRQLAKGMASTWHAKWVRIFGIAAMVYAALTVTPMHDLMVTIALVFLVAAEMVLLDWLWQRRQFPQWIAGMAHLALLLSATFVYYREVAMVALPTLQKLVFLSLTGWLLWLHRCVVGIPAKLNGHSQRKVPAG